MVIGFHSPGMRRAATALFAVMLLPTLWLGMRSYRSLVVLHTAYEAGAPATSGIRGWMTLSYSSRPLITPPKTGLRQRLGLPPAIRIPTPA